MNFSMRFGNPLKVVLAVSFLSFTSVFSIASEQQKSECQNVAKVAFRFAQRRDAGVSDKEIGNELRASYNAGSISESDFKTMFILAGFVYSALREKSPDQIRRSFLSECQ